MLPPTHLATGFLISQAAEPYLKKNTKNPILWQRMIWFFSVFPDIDLLWAWENHRFSLLHFPLFWTVLCLVLAIWGRQTKTKTLQFFALAMFLGTISHLILDSIGVFEGIYWLYPFGVTKYSLLPITVVAPGDIVGLTVTYFSHPLYIFEALICAVGIASYLNTQKLPFLAFQAK